MTLKDLLDELRLNILNDRSSRTSGGSDYLWTDATLVRYINEAHRRFAARSLVLRDATTPEVTQVTVHNGQATYLLHSSIISVLSAKLPTTINDLVRVGHSALGNMRTDNDTWDQVRLTQAPGTTLAYTTDEQIGMGDDDALSTVSMRLFPVPDATMEGTIISLRVVRKPLEKLTIGNLGASPEIPEDHHLNMLDWAAYLALRIVDHDTGDAKRADGFAASFETHVQDARKQVMKQLFAPKSWGFGKGGWAWGS